MKLTKSKILFLVAAAATLFTACQKEVDFQDLGGAGPGTGNTGVITGDYNFIGIWSRQNNSVTTTESGMELKAVAITEYASENNTGSLKVTDNKFFFTGIGHTVRGTATSYGYIDGVLFDQSIDPYEYVTPPTDQAYDYVRNNNDSLTFINGFATLPDASGGTSPVPAGPIGARISLSNDTLTLVTKFDFTSTQNQAGIPIVLDVNADGIMKFKKK